MRALWAVVGFSGGSAQSGKVQTLLYICLTASWFLPSAASVCLRISLPSSFPRSSLLSSRVRSRCCLVCVGIVCCCRPNVPRTACLQKTKRSVVTASPLLSQLLFSACSDVVAAVGLDQFITKSKSAESSSVLPVSRPTY